MAANNGFLSKIHIYGMIFVILFSLLGVGLTLGDDEGNAQGGNSQGGNSQGANSQGGNSQGGNSQGGNSQGGNSQGGNSQGGNSQGGNSQGENSQEENSLQGGNVQNIARSPSIQTEENVYIFGGQVTFVANYDLSDYDVYKSNYSVFKTRFPNNDDITSENVKGVSGIKAIAHSDSAFSFDLTDYYDLLVLVSRFDDNTDFRMIYFYNEGGNHVSQYFRPSIGWGDEDYVSHYYQAYNDLIYPGNKEKMEGKGVVYNFENKDLRSYYCFTNDKGILQPMPEESEIFSEYTATFNVTDTSQIVNFTSVYVCEIFDSFLHQNTSIPSDVAGACPEHESWEAQIDGLLTNKVGSDKLSDIFESGQLIHSKTTSSNMVNDYVEKYTRASLQFSPENYNMSPTNFILYINPNSNMIEISMPIGRDDIYVSVPDDKFNSLKSLTFPKAFIDDRGNSILRGLYLFVEEKDPKEYEHMFDSDSFNTQLHFFVDISFSGGKGDAVNEFMEENDLVVDLTFVIPSHDENGDPVNLDDIVIYHITRDEAGKEKLVPLDIVSVETDGDSLIIIAQTTGFSPFAVVTSTVIQPPPATKPRSSFNTAFIVNNTLPEDNKSEVPNNNNGPTIIPPVVVIPPIGVIDDDIVDTIHGNLSIFSIFVVLMSGIFMWNYIRRNL